MSTIQTKCVEVSLRGQRPALMERSVLLKVRDGEFVSAVGPVAFVQNEERDGETGNRKMKMGFIRFFPNPVNQFYHI